MLNTPSWSGGSCKLFFAIKYARLHSYKIIATILSIFDFNRIYISNTSSTSKKKKIKKRKERKQKKKYLKANPRCRHIDSTENEREKQVKL